MKMARHNEKHSTIRTQKEASNKTERLPMNGTTEEQENTLKKIKHPYNHLTV